MVAKITVSFLVSVIDRYREVQGEKLKEIARRGQEEKKETREYKDPKSFKNYSPFFFFILRVLCV